MANNTALRAGKDTTRTITFKNKEHEKFYYTYLPKCRYQDVYHKALVYCLGIDRDTRENAEQIYDFKTGYVKTECLHEGWQTSGSVRLYGWHLTYIVTVLPVFMIMKETVTDR